MTYITHVLPCNISYIYTILEYGTTREIKGVDHISNYDTHMLPNTSSNQEVSRHIYKICNIEQLYIINNKVDVYVQINK